MKLVIFGLTISSSWGNGHATLLRGLFKAMVARGHRIVFFERDVPYYAAHRDLVEYPGIQLHLYNHWSEVLSVARTELTGADVGMVTSYCPDGIAASEEVLSANSGLRVFYDLDTPITLEAVKRGCSLSYIGPQGLSEFDLVLSYTGGAALRDLRMQLGARRVFPLYGSVDPEVHHSVMPIWAYRSDFSYLGTYARDRQAALETLFIQPAHKLANRRFIIGGSQYPLDFPWHGNIWYVRHVPPSQHPGFYCSSPVTLNVTRGAMALMGYCPSGRLFEAAACGTAIISDEWKGLDRFFQPGSEILVSRTADDVVAAITMPLGELEKIARAGRERALDSHTARHRAVELEELLESALREPLIEASSGPYANATMPAMEA